MEPTPTNAARNLDSRVNGLGAKGIAGLLGISSWRISSSIYLGASCSSVGGLAGGVMILRGLDYYHSSSSFSSSYEDSKYSKTNTSTYLPAAANTTASSTTASSST